jgi:membrane protease YdiL (CAAX protease family)
MSAHPATDADSPRANWALLAIIWPIALACVSFVKFRAQWPAYMSLHKWMSERGVPDGVRNLDSFLLYTLTAAIGAAIACFWMRRTGERAILPAELLGLRRGRRGLGPVVLLALAPMVVGGAIIAMTSGKAPPEASAFWGSVYKGVVRAAIMEELFFRGLLVGVLAPAAIGWTGRRFWINATFAAALFASVHITWTLDAAARGWPTLLVTFAGGVWYAWLLGRWRTLWVPMILHAGMNLGWLLAGSAGGAGGGGLFENLLRAATITIATWMTVRRTRSAGS